MNFPCPHCGSDQSMTDRTEEDIKPIVPLELQGEFAEPPPPAYIDGRPEVRATAPRPKKLTADLDLAKTAQVSVSKHDFSSTTTSQGTESLLASTMDKRLTDIEGTLQTLTNEVNTIMKSQKVIEAILKRINAELMKLREN